MIIIRPKYLMVESRETTYGLRAGPHTEPGSLGLKRIDVLPSLRLTAGDVHMLKGMYG